jgi:hypothetical protein
MPAAALAAAAAPMLTMQPPPRLRICGKALFEVTTAVFRLAS